MLSMYSGAVQHVDAEVILPGLVALELAALAPDSRARAPCSTFASRRARSATCRVGQAARRGDDALAVGVAGGDGLLGESEVHGPGVPRISRSVQAETTPVGTCPTWPPTVCVVEMPGKCR